MRVCYLIERRESCSRDLDDLLRNEMNESGAGYYTFRPVEGLPWKFVVLNSYEINMINNKEHNEDKDVGTAVQTCACLQLLCPLYERLILAGCFCTM